jgi:hypothetical protein
MLRLIDNENDGQIEKDDFEKIFDYLELAKHIKDEVVVEEEGD